MRKLLIMITTIAAFAGAAWLAVVKPMPRACDDNFLDTTSVHSCAPLGGTK